MQDLGGLTLPRPRAKINPARAQRSAAIAIDRSVLHAVPASALPEPHVEKFKGPLLVTIWAAVFLGSWLVTGGVGYGLYIVLGRNFFD